MIAALIFRETLLHIFYPVFLLRRRNTPLFTEGMKSRHSNKVPDRNCEAIQAPKELCFPVIPRQLSGSRSLGTIRRTELPGASNENTSYFLKDMRG